MHARTILALTVLLTGGCAVPEPAVITIAEPTVAPSDAPGPTAQVTSSPTQPRPADIAASKASQPTTASGSATPDVAAPPATAAGTPTVRESLDDLERLLGEARIVPAFDAQGKPAGIRLAGIQRGSLLERLGFRNRDVVRAVDGEPVTDLPTALMLASKLDDPSTQTIRVGVRRGDADQVIVVNLDGPLP